MSLSFTPRTEEELNKVTLFEKGDYDFDVIGAEDTVSKSSGNPMITLTLRFYGPDGSTTTVYDYLLASVEYKVKHFCDTTGLAAEYQAGSLSADMCLNRSGKATLIIQKDKKGQYEDKNVVKDYSNVAVDASDVPF